jgi:hypothetical protein
MIRYSIPEDELHRLLDICANANLCISKGVVRSSCRCSRIAEEVDKEVLPMGNEYNHLGLP